MTDSNHSVQIETPKKKMSLQEAIKQQLESKRNQSAGKSSSNQGQTTKRLKSQQTKKANNQRRRTGV